jgi:hypothetical protein
METIATSSNKYLKIAGISVVETTVIKKADKAIFDGWSFILLFLNCV